jgi:hypothetical protein
MGGKGRVFQQAKKLSPADQLTFNRWLKGNAVVAFILAAGLVAMVMSGSNSVREPVQAGKIAPDVVANADKLIRSNSGTLFSDHAPLERQE